MISSFNTLNISGRELAAEKSFRAIYRAHERKNPLAMHSPSVRQSERDRWAGRVLGTKMGQRQPCFSPKARAMSELREAERKVMRLRRELKAAIATRNKILENGRNAALIK